MLSRSTRLPRLSAAAAAALHTALPRPDLSLLRHAPRALAPVRVCDSASVSSRLVSAPSTLLGFPSSSLSTRALSSAVFWTRDGGVHWCGGFLSRSFYAASVRNQQYERNGNSFGQPSPGSSSAGSSAVQPLQPSHLQSSLLVDDFRSLIVSRKREVAILEAALEILQTAPRDKRFEDLVRKHNIQFEPSVTKSEKRRETLESLPKLETGSQKLVLGDLAVNSDIECQPALTVEPTSQLVGSSNVEKDIVEDVIVDLEPAKSSESQQGRLRNTAQLPLSKVDTTFGKLSLSNFPSQQDPNFERLQKKRRRQEMMKEYERNNKIKSLNFGAAAKTAAGGSNPRDESPVDPLRPNASVFLEQADNKPYRSLADRLYEEQFGRPAPPGLKRTYPKGSFYDRCMKEKEQKERDAAAAAAAAARVAPQLTPRSMSLSSARPTEPRVSVSSQEDEASDNSIRTNAVSNDINQERKSGNVWKCPECTFFNPATEEYCYRCQAQRGGNGAVMGAIREDGPLEEGRELENAAL